MIAALALSCLTLAATDGHEPVCNPHVGASPWSVGHRNSYQQHTSPVAGPRRGEAIAATHLSFETTPLPGVTLGAFFSPPYPDGKRVAYSLIVNGTNDNPITKHDIDTGAVIDTFMHTTDEASPPNERAALSGIYILLSREGHLYQPRGRQIEVYGDAQPGVRTSPLTSLKKFVLPPRAKCGDGDRLVGMNMRWDGRLAFITQRGVVGVVPHELERLADEHLVVRHLNSPEACAGADDSTEGLETVSNSLSVDESGGMYPVTNRAQYRFDFAGGQIRQTWRAEYKTGTTSAVRQDSGSGSTPSLMGTDPGDDRFVAITDGAPLTNLVLFWRDEIPADWKGIAPGRDRRIACEFPLNFGDPTLTEAQNEQSVAIRGYSAIIPNNEIRNLEGAEAVYGPAAAASGLPLQLAVAGLAGGDPQFQPFGVSRIDWDPVKRACSLKWVNKEVSLPNGVPTMSAGSGMVYGIGARERTWGLEGLDFETGASTLWVPVSANSLANSFYSALSIAPDGTMWSGAEQGLLTFRPPPRPEPALTCKEFAAPTSVVRRARVTARRLVIAGRAADDGCGGLERIDVSVSLRLGSRCRFVRRDGGLTTLRSCRRPLLLAARGTATWSLRTARLPRGRYAVRSRAVDGAGNAQALVRKSSALRFAHVR